MPAERRPAFNIPYSESPFQGITDRSWTKLQEYGKDYIYIIQNCTPENPVRTPDMPIEELKAFRLDWYNPQRYVMRRGDLNTFYPWVQHIKAYMTKVNNAIGFLTFMVVTQKRPSELASRRISAHGGMRPLGAQEIQPEIEDPRLPPDFATQEQMREFFSPPKEKTESELEMEKIEAERVAWITEQDAAIELQDSMIPYSGWKRRYPDEAEYHRLMKLDTSERRERLRLSGMDQMVGMKAFSPTSQGVKSAASRLLSMSPEELAAKQAEIDKKGN